MRRKQSYLQQNLLIAFLLCMSIGSYIYVNSVEIQFEPESKVNTIYAEDMEEADEIMPDLQLIKRVMHKAMEFVTFSAPSI
jgi:hypothetical protein